MTTSTTRRRGRLLAAVGGAAAVLVALLPMTTVPAGPAEAFGTLSGGKLGQHAEHEKITRTLSTTAQDGGDERTRFQSSTMDLVAGKTSSLGAVGAPDNATDTSILPLTGLGPGYKHCDDADYLPTDGYPRTRGQADRELRECIDYFDALMGRAVRYAGQLVGSDNQLRGRETTITNCSFGWRADDSQPAKCEVLNALGRALHLVEDFWSHSNWADAKAPGPITPSNPPGLGRTDVPDFLRYPVPKKYDIPDLLITGCDDSVPFSTHCRRRVSHSDLAKDTGWIDKDTGKATPETKYGRGQVGTNFQDAVRGARKHARTTWRDLQAAIVDTYGEVRGERIIDAIVRDAPWSPCNLHRGDAAAALRAPRPGATGIRSVRVRIENLTDEKLHCTVATLDLGEWINGPGDVAPGGRDTFRTVSNAGNGTEGDVRYRIGATGPRDELTVFWRNPFFGLNAYTCKVAAGYDCLQVGSGRGDDAELTFQLRKR